VNDIIPVVSYLTKRLFPFNYTVPGESHNSIFDFPAYTKRHPRIKTMVPQFQVDAKFEDEMRPAANANTSDVFRTINFVVDLPVRIERRLLPSESSIEGAAFPVIVYVLTELQIVDQDSHDRNERGEASHEHYETRRAAKVRDRLLYGKLAWRSRDSM
jgi:uncharacterized protein (TIGR04552 family)